MDWGIKSGGSQEICAPELRWYVLRTKRSREADVVERAGRLGFDAYCPRIRLPLVPGRGRYTMASLFPNYAFVRAEYLSAFHALRWAPGVSSWLQIGGSPAYLEDEIVHKLRAQEGGRGFIKIKPPRLRLGDRVQILEGSFRGVEGLFESYASSENRIRVLLSLVTYTARVEVDLESVRRLTA